MPDELMGRLEREKDESTVDCPLCGVPMRILALRDYATPVKEEAPFMSGGWALLGVVIVVSTFLGFAWFVWDIIRTFGGR